MTEAAPPDFGDLFERLARSKFRARFALDRQDREYLARHGIEAVVRHARAFVDKRLAPAAPPNDGRQTPMRGHPVFVAQHATATCCRSCLAKWHGIADGRVLEEPERRHIVAVIEHWLSTAATATAARATARAPAQPDLFDDR
ncbi:hypothetical protein GCM10011611_52380 [Aliidongia dinghuensis]|uniref:DUF4186 domain-containing protein n=1 Tax=Aliidongia dinghuensis TaxID=1867774 RepID=A0A8J2YYN9_9PROT|nr:DUF4186 domain-containing protein [Aliidongia dinghuensis]GGF39493.1 hypothetical protein GCM10011611_52380 [Aliidongia dinghuensis]